MAEKMGIRLVTVGVLMAVWMGLLGSPVLAQRPGLAGNDHFAVNGPTPADAQAVLKEASRLREEIAMHWFGSSLPDSEPVTVIHVKESATKDEGLTWLADRYETKSHFVWLTTDAQGALGSTLAHEIAHVCLAWRFPQGMPAWANEGIASSYDDQQRMATRNRILLQCAQTQSWPLIAGVLEARRIHPSDMKAYAVSASLVQFLLVQGSRDRLLEFVERGKRQGWNEALRHSYRIDGVGQLQRRWQRWIVERLSGESRT